MYEQLISNIVEGRIFFFISYTLTMTILRTLPILKILFPNVVISGKEMKMYIYSLSAVTQFLTNWIRLLNFKSSYIIVFFRF